MTIMGALQDDFDALSIGHMICLPADSHGRLVVFVEKSRAKPSLYSRDSLLRVVFYIVHVLNMSSDCVENGIVLLLKQSNIALSEFDRLYLKYAAQIAAPAGAAFAKIKCLLIESASNRSWSIPSSMYGPVFFKIIPKRWRLRANIYSSALDLEKFGMNIKDLPKCIGGELDLLWYWESWIEHRILFEEGDRR